MNAKAHKVIAKHIAYMEECISDYQKRLQDAQEEVLRFEKEIAWRQDEINDLREFIESDSRKMKAAA